MFYGLHNKKQVIHRVKSTQMTLCSFQLFELVGFFQSFMSITDVG